MKMVKIEPLGGGYVVLIDVMSKLWKGLWATIIQSVMPKIFSKKLKDRTEFPIAYALVCRKTDESEAS